MLTPAPDKTPGSPVPKIDKKSTAENKKVQTSTGEFRSPLALQRAMLAEEQKRESIAKQLRDALKGQKLKPGEVMRLVANALLEIQENTVDQQNRYQEVQNGYIFLEYLQATLSGKVQLVPAEVATNTMLGLLAWVGDMASGGNFYELAKQRWWWLNVNRPDPNERQSVRDRVLNSSDASYVELYQFKDTVRRVTAPEGWASFGRGAINGVVTGFAYEHLRALAVHRHEQIGKLPVGQETTLPFAALAKKDKYTIVIHRGPYARKIAVPRDWLEDETKYREFHEYVTRAMTQELPTRKGQQSPWIDTRETNVRKRIKVDYQRGYRGTEDTDSARRRRLTADLTAADLSLSIAQEKEMKIDLLQQDYRTSTYGVGIPVALAFGIDENGELQSYATKHAHPYTDGAYAASETKRIASTVFEDRMKQTMSVVNANVTPSEISSRTTIESGQRQVVWERAISREKYMSRINALREFFGDEANIQALVKTHPQLRDKLIMIRGLTDSITIQNLLSLSIMVAFQHQHAHFLEAVRMKDARGKSKSAGLAPAIGVLPPELRSRLAGKQATAPLEENTMLDLFTAISVLDVSRDLTRRGKGPAHIFDTLLAIKPLKTVMQGAGTVLDAQKTEMLTNTTMFSFLVGGAKPFGEESDYMAMQGFSTAFAEIYQDEVFGACDRVNQETGEDEILVTMRRKRQRIKDDSLTPDMRMQGVEIILNRILTYLERYTKFQPVITAEMEKVTLAR